MTPDFFTSPIGGDETTTHAVSIPDNAAVPNLTDSRALRKVDDWVAFGFADAADATHGIAATLPSAMVVLRPSASADRDKLATFLRDTGVRPSMIIMHPEGPHAFFRVSDTETYTVLRNMIADGIRLDGPGDTVLLPRDGSERVHDQVGSVEAFNALNVAALAWADPTNAPKPGPVMVRTPLLAYSLKGSAARFEAEACDAAPLLGEVCMTGQATIWYAPPNAGKTLIALSLLHEAVQGGRIEAANTYYINADDNHAGLTQKLRLMDDLGVHTLAPGYKGFASRDLLTLLRSAADRDEARGTFIIIDTVKKCTSLMDKKESSTFADACRAFVMKGGTLLGLAHTAKNPNADGRLRYAGTTDLLEDFDASYLLTPLNDKAEACEKVVEFTVMKKRGDSAEAAAYAYAAERGTSYEERLMSVRPVDLANLDDFKEAAAFQSDDPIIKAVLDCIGEGIVQKIELAKAAADRAKVSSRAAIRVLERYTGNDPTNHRWQNTIKARGAKVFEVLNAPPQG